MDELHSGSAPSIEQNLGGERVDLHREVRPALGGSQISDRGAAAPPAMAGGVVVAGSLLRRTVEAFKVQGNAERAGGGDEGVAELVAREARDLQLGFRPVEIRR